MKKVLIPFILLCIICTPKSTFSQNSFQDLIQQFGGIEKQLNYFSQDLLKINKASSNQHETYFLSSITNSISSSEDIISNTMDFIFLYPAIKDEHKLNLNRYIQLRLSSLKKQMESEIKFVQTAYAGINNQAALHLIDKAKDQMRASLILFDRSIEVLKIDKNTESKK
jgi:hypothetical protein